MLFADALKIARKFRPFSAKNATCLRKPGKWVISEMWWCVVVYDNGEASEVK